MKTLALSLMMAFSFSVLGMNTTYACGAHSKASSDDKTKVEQASYETEKAEKADKSEKASEARKDCGSKKKASEKSETRSKDCGSKKSTSASADADDE